MESVISASSLKVSDTVMEYIKGLTQEYSTESSKGEILMDRVMKGGQLGRNIGDIGRMAWNTERQSHKRREYTTDANIIKANSSAGVKYAEILKFLNTN